MSLSKALTAAAGNAGGAGESLYVEDVFSTYLYEGNDSNGSTEQEIVNGLDLDGEGGMVWMKSRDGGRSHCLYDTERGNGDFLASNTTDQSYTNTSTPWRPTSTGFFTGKDYGGSENQNNEGIVSWSFRKAEKFFDVVTFTVGLSTVFNHSLGVIPGCIIIKSTSSASDWSVVHIGANGIAKLNSSAANTGTSFPGIGTSGAYCNCTSTTFDVSNFVSQGQTYVAYLFASDAGGFGDDGSENIIKCGSYTASAGVEVDLGFEPQWILTKSASNTGDWYLFDNMRGWGADQGSNDKWLRANVSGAEYNNTNSLGLTPTGFTSFNASGQTYIYIAIRRPMKTPESGTEVFAPVAWTGNGAANRVITGAGFTPDLFFENTRTNAANYWNNYDRLRGVGQALRSYTNAAETAGTSYGMSAFGMDGHTLGSSDGGAGGYNESSKTAFAHYFKRATGFFDVVAYTGTGSATTQAHNLGVVPEMIIVKRRDNTTTTQGQWKVYTAPTGNQKYLTLENDNSLSSVQNTWQSTTPTSEEFYLGTGSNVVNNGGLFIAYLFATLAGVSKVGSFTHTQGTATNVDCGFANGARFVLWKKYNGTDGWQVYDSVRGIVAGADPFLQLNSTSAEITEDLIDPYAAGFSVASGKISGSYIFLAIA